MSWTPYRDEAAAAWDAFVVGQAAGRFVHRTGFKDAVERTYGLRPFYWACEEEDGGRLRGVFPAFFHRSLLYGRKVVSQPFSEYGGPLLAADLSREEKAEALRGLAERLAAELGGTRYGLVEMRSPLGLGDAAAGVFRAVSYFTRAERAVVPPDVLWKELSAKDRNVIQKARSFGLEFKPEEGTEALRRGFYPVYLRTMKRLGSPPHPLAYFLRLRERLDDAMRLFLVRYRGRVVAGIVGWAQGRTVQVTDMCSDERYFHVKPNDFGLWEFLSWAHGAGLATFDFGPVRYRGQEVFKKKWRMELSDFACLYWPPDAAAIRSPYAEPGRAARLAPALWRALVPKTLGRAAGRRLRREVGL